MLMARLRDYAQGLAQRSWWQRRQAVSMAAATNSTRMGLGGSGQGNVALDLNDRSG